MSSTPYRVGQWLPSDRKVIDKWLANLIKEVNGNVKAKKQLDAIKALHAPAEDETTALGGVAAPPANYFAEAKKIGLHEPVEELMNAILSDPEINMFFHQMFWQQSPYASGVTIGSWQVMIILINFIMTKAPKFNKTGLVGFPINVILNWTMPTTAGFAAFLNNKVNRLAKNLNCVL